MSAVVPIIDPAGELFMLADSLPDQLIREEVLLDCVIEVEDARRRFGWRGWLLRETETSKRHLHGWLVGNFNPRGAGNMWLALGKDGLLYFGKSDPPEQSILKSALTEQDILVLRDAVELDHCHFGPDSFAVNVLRKLEQFADEALRR